MKLTIPILGIAGLCFSIYFLLEPHLKLADGYDIVSSPMEYFSTEDSTLTLTSISIPITNTGFKSGYVAKAELTPFSVNFLPYTINKLEIDQDPVTWKAVVWVKITMNVTYPKNGSVFQTANSSIKNYNPLRLNCMIITITLS